MQDYPFNLPLSEYPLLTPQMTDTAHPKQAVPIYYIHTLQQPFCPNPFCKCHRQQTEVKQNIPTGSLMPKSYSNPHALTKTTTEYTVPVYQIAHDAMTYPLHRAMLGTNIDQGQLFLADEAHR